MTDRAWGFVNVEQRSPDWYAARCGRLTGSRAADMLATIKTGEAAARRDYRAQLVVERLTGQPQQRIYRTDAIQWGVDCEPLALATYEAMTGQIVERSGFIAHRDYLAGCSLDGHVDDCVGIVEIKCPNTATHYRYLRDGAFVPAEHIAQVRHNVWITGATWLDFLSFDPRMPPRLQTFLVRVYARDLDIPGYAAKAIAFLAEVDRDVSVARGWSVFDDSRAAQILEFSK